MGRHKKDYWRALQYTHISEHQYNMLAGAVVDFTLSLTASAEDEYFMGRDVQIMSVFHRSHVDVSYARPKPKSIYPLDCQQ